MYFFYHYFSKKYYFTFLFVFIDYNFLYKFRQFTALERAGSLTLDRTLNKIQSLNDPVYE